MAKATANCTCKRCGNKFTRTNICRNRKDANSLESLSESTFTLCPDCYKEEHRELERQQPLTLTISIDTAGILSDLWGENLLNAFATLVWSGPAYDAKEQIKKLGYHWGEIQSQKGLGILFHPESRPCWHKTVQLADLREKLSSEIEAAESLGAVVENNITEDDLKVCAEIQAEKEKLDAERQKKD